LFPYWSLVDARSSDTAEVRISRLTVFLARSIGLFTILLTAGFLVRGSAVIEITVADVPVMLAYAIISLAMGVSMVLGEAIAGLIGRMRYGESYYLSLVPAFLLGLYLTWAGLAAQASRRL
jgi:hypothetical protein